MSRRLLAISWDMPPLSGPRAVQVSRTLKHLVPLGWESSVVCFGPRSGRYNQDPELASRLRAPDGVTLVPVPSLEERLVFRALWRVLPPLKLLPDEKWVWIGAASRTARRLAPAAPFRRARVVRAALVGSSDRLARASSNWTAVGRAFQRSVDRQPVSARPRSGSGGIWRRMEADVVREADALVFVNSQTADRVMQKYPASWRRKGHVVPHGFDGDTVCGCRPPDALIPGCELVYTGRFYDGIRTPESLLRALATLAGRRPLESELHLTLVGTPLGSQQRLARDLQLDRVVEFTGRLSFAESARIAAGADVLLLIDAPSDDSLFLPSKLVDYLPMCKPILALTPVNGASADLMRSLGYPIVPPDDEAAIVEAIEALDSWRKGRGVSAYLAQHADVSQRYDIRRTTEAFAAILVQCA